MLSMRTYYDRVVIAGGRRVEIVGMGCIQSTSRGGRFKAHGGKRGEAVSIRY